jgi:hypothetical protein
MYVLTQELLTPFASPLMKRDQPISLAAHCFAAIKSCFTLLLSDNSCAVSVFSLLLLPNRRKSTPVANCWLLWLRQRATLALQLLRSSSWYTIVSCIHKRNPLLVLLLLLLHAHTHTLHCTTLQCTCAIALVLSVL